MVLIARPLPRDTRREHNTQCRSQTGGEWWGPGGRSVVMFRFRGGWTGWSVNWVVLWWVDWVVGQLGRSVVGGLGGWSIGSFRGRWTGWLVNWVVPLWVDWVVGWLEDCIAQLSCLVRTGRRTEEEMRNFRQRSGQAGGSQVGQMPGRATAGDADFNFISAKQYLSIYYRVLL